MAVSENYRAAAERHARDSRFIFLGKFERDGANLSLAPPNSNPAVVRVERVFRAAPALGDQRGQLITLMRPQPGPTREAGADLVFFTNPVLYGETLGVREIAHLQAPEDLDELGALVHRAIGDADMDALRRHLASAAAIVVGKVVETRSAVEPDHVPFSEHDPDWWIATIHVARSLKGRLKGDIRVRYPNSRDIAWYRAPKPREGQEAIFVLHEDGARNAGGVALAILDPDDMLPADPETIRRISNLL
jgi:catechol 2,3-dioxygenase-like lactoylglutathione lyase family enzyme